MDNRLKLVIEALEDLEINSPETRFEMARIIAIEELEKQISKKVDYSELNYSNLPVSKCPKCNSTVINSDRLLSSAKYCPECGQKLNWDIENE